MADKFVLEEFNSMQQSGLLDDLAALRLEIRELDKVINDAALLITNSEIDQMLQFLIDRILDHFIPQYLAFIIQPPRGESIRQYCYRNLKPCENQVPDKYYDILRDYFSGRYSGASFKDIENELGAETFPQDFRDLVPELIYPMHGIGGIYGFVILGKKFTSDEYGIYEKIYMDRMIRFLSVSIQNGLHHESTLIDPKTGLYNYEYFISRVNEEMALADRYGSHSGLLILDVDNFKRFNDTYGHVTGDKALLSLAQVLKRVTRKEDCVARFGGEEFSILLANCNSAMLFEVSERIRIEVEKTPVFYEAEKLHITVSIGACIIENTSKRDAKELLEDADKALYKAKENGRNRTEIFTKGFLEKAAVIRLTNQD